MKLVSGKNHMLSALSAVAMIALCLTCAFCEASIENEPVKVTHRNSGPSYDIDDVERTRLNPDNAENTISNQPERSRPSALEQPDGEAAPIGHLSIRRIFLVPMMPQQDSVWTRSQQDGPSNGHRDQSSDELPSLFAGSRPLWPFMAPASPAVRHQAQQPHRHLFGADEASRPPKAEASDEQAGAERAPPSQADLERDESMDRLRPIFDPIRMMVDLMQQALNPAAGTGGLFGDVGRESGAQPVGDNKEAASENSPDSEVMGRPIKPAANETKEEIVEIDGKKYLRKTVISRHVGENIIFMTRRLIFVPLNETDSVPTTQPTTAATTSTTTAIPTSTSNLADGTTTSGFIVPDENRDTNREPKIEQPTTTTTTTSSPTAATSTTTVASESQPTIASAPSSEVPVTTTTTTQVPTSTKATESEETTPKVGEWNEKVPEAVDRIAERLFELGVSNNSKPVVAEPAARQLS